MANAGYISSILLLCLGLVIASQLRDSSPMSRNEKLLDNAIYTYYGEFYHRWQAMKDYGFIEELNLQNDETFEKDIDKLVELCYSRKFKMFEFLAILLNNNDKNIIDILNYMKLNVDKRVIKKPLGNKTTFTNIIDWYKIKRGKQSGNKPADTTNTERTQMETSNTGQQRGNMHVNIHQAVAQALAKVIIEKYGHEEFKSLKYWQGELYNRLRLQNEREPYERDITEFVRLCAFRNYSLDQVVGILKEENFYNVADLVTYMLSNQNAGPEQIIAERPPNWNYWSQ